eukprot:sb/3462416/
MCRYKNLSKEDFSYKDHNWPCNLTFICDPRNPNTNYLDPNSMCDGRTKEKCPIEAALCKVSRGKNVDSVVRSITRTRKVLPECVNPGSVCRDYPWMESYGTMTTVISAPSKVVCKEKFGEHYVYPACLGLCEEEDVRCPLPDIDYSTSCLQLPNRTMTLSKENNLVFVEKHANNFVVGDSFPCTNGRCVSYSQVCDLTNDCGDFSDELNCTNRFTCQVHEIIKTSQVCDGKIDCSNAKDECDPDVCPQNAKKKILTSEVLQVFGWLIAIPATIINTMVIYRNSRKLFQEEFSSRINYCVTVLITLISFGDFLVGVYLLCISIENITRRQEFCKNEMAWLTSPTCEFYGVISTFGSELSVLAMTLIAVYRAYVMRRVEQAKIPNGCFKVKLFLGCVMVTMVSFFIAIIPTNEKLREMYFFNGYFIANAQLFQGYQRNTEFLPLLRTYYGNNSVEAGETSVRAVRENLRRMFGEPLDEDGGDQALDFKILGFYGSSGSCTFKFFVDKEDPQRHYTWCILTLNVFCLVVIALSYLSVHVYTQHKAERVGHRQWFGALQRKISLIIFTDSLCWVPLILVCFLHYINLIDATSLYPTFSTVVLPINSLLNPLLYDGFFSAVPDKGYRIMRRFLMRVAVVARENSLHHIYSFRSDSMVTKNVSTAGVLHNTGVTQLSTNNLTDDTAVIKSTTDMNPCTENTIFNCTGRERLQCPSQMSLLLLLPGVKREGERGEGRGERGGREGER